MAPRPGRAPAAPCPPGPFLLLSSRPRQPENAPWGISAETQFAEGGTVPVRVVANENYDLGTPLQASVQ